MTNIQDDGLWELAIRVRNGDDRFSGEESPAAVLKQVMVDQYAELQSDERAAEAKQAELKANLGVGDSSDSDGVIDDVSRRQARLKERILR